MIAASSQQYLECGTRTAAARSPGRTPERPARRSAADPHCASSRTGLGSSVQMRPSSSATTNKINLYFHNIASAALLTVAVVRKLSGAVSRTSLNPALTASCRTTCTAAPHAAICSSVALSPNSSPSTSTARVIGVAFSPAPPMVQGCLLTRIAILRPRIHSHSHKNTFFHLQPVLSYAPNEFRFARRASEAGTAWSPPRHCHCCRRLPRTPFDCSLD